MDANITTHYQGNTNSSNILVDTLTSTCTVISLQHSMPRVTISKPLRACTSSFTISHQGGSTACESASPVIAYPVLNDYSATCSSWCPVSSQSIERKVCTKEATGGGCTFRCDCGTGLFCNEFIMAITGSLDLCELSIVYN